MTDQNQLTITDLKNESIKESANTASETERRNKRRKPPNYYQSADYAAILKPDDSTTSSIINKISSISIQERTDNINENLNSLKNNINLANQSESIQKETEKCSENTNENIEDSINTINSNEINQNPKEIDAKKETKSNIKPDTSTFQQLQNKPSQGMSWSNLFKNRTSEIPSDTSSSLLQTTNLKTNGKVISNNNNNISSDIYSEKTAMEPSASSSDVLRVLGFMFKQCELKHSAPALQPRGIKNKNNWCYVNATLQALLACPPFYNLIKSIFIKIKNSNANIKNVPCIASLGRYVSEFKIMVRNQNDSKVQSKELVIGESLEIEYFYETLATLKSELSFKNGRQEDAQEFLSFLLNCLHEEMVKCLDSLNSNNPNTNNHNVNTVLPSENNLNDENNKEIDNNDDWKEVGKKNRAFITRKAEFKQSPLSDIFCGQFRSSLTQTGSKDKDSLSLEPFFTLPLDIQSDSVRTIQQALEYFVQKEEVFGYTNQETKQEAEAFKRISFEDLPPVLILYLKCFVYDKQGGIQKLLKRLDFQIDLEINKELISPNQRSKLKEKKRIYKLFAVEYHYGDRANGGHYITDVYHPGIVGWVRYDDANVKVVNNSQVLKSDDKKLTPYLLYYRRTDFI